MSDSIFYRFLIILFFLTYLVVAGCAAVIVGIGAGAGAIAYSKGKLNIKYDSEYHETVQASIDTLNHLKMQVADEMADELKTTINAIRPDGTPISIDVVRIDSGLTEVGIRTGRVGLWDQKVSQQIHDFLAKRLRQHQKIIPVQIDSQSKEYSTEPFQKPPTEDTTKSIVDKDNTQVSPKAKSNNKDHPNNLIKISGIKDFTLFFSQDSNELSDNQIEKLNRVSKIIHENPTAKIKIISYAYSLGDSPYNKMISDSRANMVKVYLAAKGVDHELIEVVGHGASNSIAGDDGKVNREMNNRVEIEIYTFKHD
jgi:outer membrane protein OmpA-like peptidoglycan-associated protein